MARIRVEVIFALPREHALEALELDEGATAGEAIRASGLLARYPDIDLEKNGVGVFGRLVPLDALLRDGDRVEIYRPLAADPKELRRRRLVRR
jgi:putative ubiquitin-RnfH superfamily antitoxin RatB of RatAB toxin-antitoxin module